MFLLSIKIANMADTKVETVEEEIVNYLESEGIKMSHVAGKMELSPGHLHCMLKGEGTAKRELTDDNLKKLNKILRKRFKRKT